uniref:cellulase n=1 Tax=Ciona intestinalis TaxID=7719 RepID=F6RWX2_CIOIN
TCAKVCSLCTTLICQSSMYNYAEALAKSMLFYEAQRSGSLPPNQRVRWRGNSAMNDGSDNNIDLSGGYYDGAGYIKYNFPMAFSSTLISWSVIRYGRTYRALGQYNHALDTIKWATDYFIKCHPEPNLFYGQVSDKSADSQFFGRPEDMTYQRRSYKIDFTQPEIGTDLAAEAAAAMASAAIVYKTVNPSYSNTLQQHAVELYNFATTAPRRPYSRSIRHAAQAYGTEASSYKDELAWAALWLYKLTRLPVYLNDAKRIVNLLDESRRRPLLNVNVKTAGVQLLLSEMTNTRRFKAAFKLFCTHAQPEQSSNLLSRSDYTNRGLLYVNQWGPLRYAANTAFICAMAADNNVDTERNRVLAQNQLNYILGSNGRSFVVGFGTNPPTKVFHQSSYCPPPPAACNRFDAETPNAHILYGALVGGPSESDSFMNQRMNQKQSSVTLDYNAGYQATLAAVLDLYI